MHNFIHLENKTKIKLLFLIFTVMILGAGCKNGIQPKKPFIITTKYPSQGIWNFTYVGSNGETENFYEITDKYNIGDTIK